jgi:hypothetical protein
MAKTKKLGDLVNQTISTNAPLSGGANLTDTLSLSITKANTTTDGYVSKEDWNIFNNKQDALGFTPYNATNPDGYISGITSGMVTTALGFTPYDSANPDGYITSSALTSYVPYTGATADVDLGTHSLTASDLIIDHASGSGVAASITKGGNGEALTVVKSSGSGNVASFTGGNTFISTLTTPTINGVSGLLSFGSTDRVSVGNYATPSAQRIFTVGQDTAWITIGSLPTATSFGGIWINQSSITQNNACIYASITDVTFQAPTTLFLRAQTVNVITLKQNTFSAIPFGSGSGAVENFTFTKPTNTGQTASTSISGFVVNGGSRQWNTGNIATQSENVWGATTYSFVGASTITNAYGNVFNAAIAGTNCTITNRFSALFNAPISLTQTVTTETVVQTKTVTMVINGTTYKLLAA